MMIKIEEYIMIRELFQRVSQSQLSLKRLALTQKPLGSTKTLKRYQG